MPFFVLVNKILISRLHQPKTALSSSLESLIQELDLVGEVETGLQVMGVKNTSRL